MKKLIFVAVAVSIALAGNAFALPMIFDVWEVDPISLNQTKLGEVAAVQGDTDAESYYNYYSASGHPDLPDPQPTTSQVWLYYDNNSNLSFNLIHGADGTTENYWNHVEWDLSFENMSYSKLFQDDTPENRGEEGIVDHGAGLVQADFAYSNNTDGGIIGMDPFDCCNWAVNLRPYTTGDITNIRVGSGDGSYLNLWSGNAYANEFGDADDYISAEWEGPIYRFTPQCVPEPGTLLLLGSGLLMGAGVLRRKRD